TLEDSGRNVIVRGAGTTDGSNFGAAVCIFEFAKTTSNTHGDKPFQAQGLARIVQVHESLSFFDITVSGLKPGEYTVGIHSSGDMSNIPTSCGGLFRRIFGGALPDAHKPAGDLGTMIVGENGWGDLVVESEEIKVYEIIGRSMLIQSKPGSPSSNAPSTTSTPSLTCLAGIIARSAGLFQNDKQICACSGATMWEEQRISRSNGGGGRK
ncbi:copper chaperone, partial [Spiromyces aspiralis]